MKNKIFLIADTHFNHLNIIKYCNRPFLNVEMMNSIMISNWNNTVSNNDIVYILGDFALDKERIKHWTEILNGTKYLVKGNHDDYSNQFYRDCGFKEVYDKPILVDFCLLSHEPLQLNETTPYFNFYGHIHNDSKFQDNTTSKCVSVERINYTPYLWKIT